MFQNLISFMLEDIWRGLLTVLLVVVISRLLLKQRLNLPPGPISLPIVGYLPFLGAKPFLKLRKLGERYGNVFSLRLGTKYAVVLNDILAINDGFQKSSTLFRPENLCSFIPGNLGFVASNGADWAEQRRFTFRMMKILGFSGSSWELLVQDETEDLLKSMYELKGQAVDIASMLTSRITNNMSSFIFGKRLHAGHPTRIIIDRSIGLIPRLFRQTGMAVFFPTLSNALGRLNFLSYGKDYEELVQCNEAIRSEVLKRKAEVDEGENTYVGEYLKEMAKQGDINVENYFSVETLVGNIKALFIGGGEVVNASLRWLFLAMAAFPEKQAKVHRELDDLGRDGIPSWEMRTKLVYTHATVMEGQRWRTVAPLSLLHEASENTTICGYDVPKGSIIIANLWNTHNDEKYWQNPHEFIPERFLEENGTKLISKPSSYVPFSVGKRNCPGDLMGLMESFIMFASIMSKFDIFPPSDDRLLNLEGRTGSSYVPVEKELRFVPRH